jgi:hypothetical protein
MERAARTGQEVRRAAEENLKDMAHEAAQSFTRDDSPGSSTPRSGTGV